MVTFQLRQIIRNVVDITKPWLDVHILWNAGKLATISMNFGLGFTWPIVASTLQDWICVGKTGICLDGKWCCYYKICQDSTLFEKNCFVNYPLRICSLVMQPYSNTVAWCSKSGKMIGIFIYERFMVIIPIVEGSLSCCF